ARSVRALDGILACIVGHSSLYVVFERRPDIEAAIRQSVRQPATGNRQRVTVSFRDEYATDLAEFLTHANVTGEEFLGRVRELRLVVRYLGFRGGFAYLDGWPAEWAMPRRATSRPVARGSFAIAGGVAGFYPIDTPGGWNILGRTADVIENRFVAGDVIEIEPSVSTIQDAPRVAVARIEIPGISAPFMTRVHAASWRNLERGISVGGPFDIEAAQAANAAVGQPPDAELLEFAQVGPRVTPDSPVMLGWCDANGVRVQRVRRDETYDFGRIRNGLRGYLAIGERPGHVRELKRDDRLVIRTMRGPHDIGLAQIECEVTPSIDRIGIRMRPLQPIATKPPADLPSIGMQFGSLQLHPDGSIVAMGPDHPVTGGYLQPMTVLWSERWKLAHLAPGEKVKFLAQP
ncbi:MAG TPA: carboxyltransferase domain-containing protein, partial [Thermoanaerobaculia bacterium]